MPRSPSPDEQTPTSRWKLAGLVGFLAGVVATLGFVHIDPLRPHDLTPPQHIAACEKAHKVPKDTTMPLEGPSSPEVLRRCTWPPVNEAADGYYEINYDEINYDQIAPNDRSPQTPSMRPDYAAHRLGTPCTTVQFQTVFNHMTEISSNPVTVRTGLVVDDQGHPQMLEDPWIDVIAAPRQHDLVIMLGANTFLHAVDCVR